MENWRRFLKEDLDDAYVDTKTKGLGSSEDRYQAGAKEASKQIPEHLKKEQQIILSLTEEYHERLKYAKREVYNRNVGVSSMQDQDISDYTWGRFGFPYGRYGLPNLKTLTGAINNLNLGKDKEYDDDNWINKEWFPKYAPGFIKLAKTILERTRSLMQKIVSERGKISKTED